MQTLSDRFRNKRIVDSTPAAGKASRYIQKFKIKPGQKVYMVSRKSGRERRYQLDKHEANLRSELEAAGADIVGSMRHIGPGYDPSWIGVAAFRAKNLGATAIVAECTNRLIRNRDYHPKYAPDLQPTKEDLRQLRSFANGMPLMTLLDPDASPKEERVFQRKRGGVGRPRKKKYKGRYTERPNKFARVKRLRDKGKSLREIERMVGRSESTIRGWLAKA